MCKKPKLRYFLPKFQDHFVSKPLLRLLISVQISLNCMPIFLFSEVAHSMILSYLCRHSTFTFLQTDFHLSVRMTDIDLKIQSLGKFADYFLVKFHLAIF